MTVRRSRLTHICKTCNERLRFDFNLDRKMTPEEITKAETLVNGWIAEDHPVKYTLYPTQEALDRGAIGPFGERYGDTVKVYQMGADDHVVSLEICGGVRTLSIPDSSLKAIRRSRSRKKKRQVRVFGWGLRACSIT